jgi:hypothetical protein
MEQHMYQRTHLGNVALLALSAAICAAVHCFGGESGCVLNGDLRAMDEIKDEPV